MDLIEEAFTKYLTTLYQDELKAKEFKTKKYGIFSMYFDYHDTVQKRLEKHNFPKRMVNEFCDYVNQYNEVLQKMKNPKL